MIEEADRFDNERRKIHSCIPFAIALAPYCKLVDIIKQRK